MRAVFLSDNISNCGLEAEWGLSVYIEFEGHKILLDTGAGPLFAKNADALGVDLSAVEFGVLSHAHYDHADGMDEFFRINDQAPFYLQDACGEDCYDLEEGGKYKYIGIKRGLLQDYRDRIVTLRHRFSPLPGVTILPHTMPDLMAVGVKAHMFRQTRCCMVPDDFSHEQSLVFETEKGLVVFNSCCHAGADRIVTEVAEAFPGSPIYAVIGGFHLYDTPPEEVRAFAGRLRDTGVQHIITGHCTGQEGFDILKEELGDKVRQTEVGLELGL